MAPKPTRREAQVAHLQADLAEIFTPGEPIDDPSLFSGRTDLLEDLRAQLPIGGMHFVLYGERGVGKTSLWQVVLHGWRIQQHSASASDDFVSIFLRVLVELGEQFTDDERTRIAEVTSSLGKEGVASVGSKAGEEATEKPIADRKLDLNFVLDRIARRAKSLDAVVIDEFQNISRRAVQTQIIEVVKGFADRKVDVKIFLVGVADSDDELIPSKEYPQYKGRHFFVRRVTRMSDSELRDILDVREKRFHIGIEDDVKDSIVRIAGGYPPIAHRLALRAAQFWAARAHFESIGGVVGNLVGLLMGYGPSVEKAGVHVETPDLGRAVAAFARDFRADYPDLTASYEQANHTFGDGAAIDRLLSALISSPTTRTQTESLAATTGLPIARIDSLIDGAARGLVERVGNGCQLKVRGVGPFIEATRFLAQERSSILRSTTASNPE